MRMRDYWPILAIGLLSGVAKGGNEIASYVFCAGGGTATSAHHSIGATIGEAIVGSASSAHHSIDAGFS